MNTEIPELNSCCICPHQCKVNRNAGIVGRCHCTNEIKIALASVHNYEEPCISEENGSGTIFFSNCNLHCLYCQNYKISQQGKGKVISISELANIFLMQQKKGVNNINLVTPTMYVYQIRKAIEMAREKGFCLPVIYNTNGYETVETIRALEGYVDIYLPDLKYYSNTLSRKYSKVDNYFSIATKAIQEMIRQVGAPIFAKEKNTNNMIIQRGVIIRHLILPAHLQNTKNILKWIHENLSEDIYVSIMAQYFPTYHAKEDALINRKLTPKEYKEIETYLYTLNLKNGYIQELGEHEEEYVPKWDV